MDTSRFWVLRKEVTGTLAVAPGRPGGPHGFICTAHLDWHYASMGPFTCLMKQGNILAF